MAWEGSQRGSSRPLQGRSLAARLMPCVLAVTITAPSNDSLHSGPVRWRPSVLVPPAQEAGWAGQDTAQDRRSAWSGSIAPLPFAEHLATSNRIARESDSVEVPFDLAVFRRPLGREKTHPLVVAGNDHNRPAQACKPCPKSKAEKAPITERINRRLAQSAEGQLAAKALAAYQPRPRYSVGRMLDVVV